MPHRNKPTPQFTATPAQNLQQLCTLTLLYPHNNSEVDDNELLRMLEFVNLPDLADRFGGLEAVLNWEKVLSIGEQQRLALARAWACKPTLLLADEPTANLAPTATREVERLIQAVQMTGTTLMLTTHNVAQAKRLAKRIVFLEGGRLVEDRPAAEFFASPQSAAARSYLEGESL